MLATGVGAESFCCRWRAVLVPEAGAGDGAARAPAELPQGGFELSEALRTGVLLVGVWAFRLPEGRGVGDDGSGGSGDRILVPNLALAVEVYRRYINKSAVNDRQQAHI